MTTLPMANDCCFPCSGASSACTVTCTGDGTTDIAVGTTAELRAFPGPFTNFQTKEKLGDITYDDGFGAFYYFDSNSFLDDNGASVVKPNEIDSADPGRWRQSV